MVLVMLMCLMLTPAYAEKVVKVYDGDSVKTDLRTIRLHGIDAPERKPPPGCRGKGQPYWDYSRQALQALLPVGVEVAPVCHGKSFERDVCDIGAVNSLMVLSGAAFSTGPYDTQQAEAQQNLRGLWAFNTELPTDYRKRMRDAKSARKAGKSHPN